MKLFEHTLLFLIEAENLCFSLTETSKRDINVDMFIYCYLFCAGTHKRGIHIQFFETILLSCSMEPQSGSSGKISFHTDLCSEWMAIWSNSPEY